jgi:steroid delta-isomerase-like uncharacterized protein
MEIIEVARRYLDAWNHHDSAAITATFATGGTYSDPIVPQGLTGPAVAHYASGLFGAFPDLSFDVVSAAPAGEKTVAVQRLMRGTNTGPLQGNSPTARKVVLPGADFIVVEGNKVRSVQGYFDQKTFVEQLGLQAIVVPTTVGPISFGYSAHMSPRKPTKPGAVSLTWIDARSDEEEREVRDRSLQILGSQMAPMPGFLGWVGSVVDRRMLSDTAWNDPSFSAQLLVGGPHWEAGNRALGGDLGAAVFTSVWVPHHLNAIWVRCTSCRRMVDFEQRDGQCQCGHRLPEQPPYW